ncbi:MAG: AbrB/MazE/SpoVT family DNA-binding domain-containing protein [Armatimonadota bacterium]|nr:AbrB/MazE/SpoVT family DNA-binding domain-containing protein [Armatimonadota bacterium]
MQTPKSPLTEHFCGTVTVGERGQVVIPAEVRKQFGIESGDKLLVFRHPMMACVTMLKIDAVRDFLEQFLDALGRSEAGAEEVSE